MILVNVSQRPVVVVFVRRIVGSNLAKSISFDYASEGARMLRAAIIFFILGLISVLLGAYGIAGLSIEIGRILLAVFLVFAVISFIASIITGKNRVPLP